MFINWLLILVVWTITAWLMRVDTPPLVAWMLLCPFFVQDVHDSDVKKAMRGKADKE